MHRYDFTGTNGRRVMVYLDVGSSASDVQIGISMGGAHSSGSSAVDGTGQTIEFMLSAKRDKKAAKRFFRKALGRDNTRNPRTVVTDRLKSYPGALREMKRDGELWRFTQHRRGQWLDNPVEQD